MIYVALAEAVIILTLIMLLNKRQRAEVDTIVSVFEMVDKREAELLNAARNPGYIIPTGPHPERVQHTDDELERMRRHAENVAKIGRVE